MRLGGFPSLSSSSLSGAFLFFLVFEALLWLVVLVGVGWLLSRIVAVPVGAGTCDGVVCVLDGELSYTSCQMSSSSLKLGRQQTLVKLAELLLNTRS